MIKLTPTDAQCGGLWKEDPHWGRLYKLECMDCARRVYTPDKTAALIYPWDGHGPCPDWLPSKAVQDASVS